MGVLSSRLARLLTAVLLGSAAVSAQESFADLAARASAASRSENPQSAIPIFNAALQLQPDWKEGLWMSGSLLYDADRYSDAVLPLKKLVSLASDFGPALALLGLCEYETHDFGPALEHIQSAIRLGVSNPQMLAVLKFHDAALTTRFRHFDEALDRYTGFMSGDVKDRQALIALGILSLRRALAPPEVVDSEQGFYLAAGTAFSAFLANDRARAAGMYQELVRQYPGDADVHYAYGYFLFGPDPKAAMEEWNRSTAIDPSHAAAHAMLAWAFSLRGDRKEALGHARAALAKDRDLVVAQVVMGRELVETGEMAGGLEHLETAVKLQPNNLEAHLGLATAYSQASRKDDARREREFCLKMQSEKAAAQP